MPGSVEVEKLLDYMRVAEAADYLGVSPNTLRNWVNAEKIAAIRRRCGSKKGTFSMLGLMQRLVSVHATNIHSIASR
jgi:excisionase family DNA binding protein